MLWEPSDASLVKCLLTFVYGPPYKNLCNKFWNDMDNLGVSYNDLWVCIEDFNTITSPDAKFGGQPFDYFSSNLFSVFMDEFGIIDLGSSGNSFRWSNHRQGLSLIKERLDKGIANCNWIHYFPSYSVVHLPAHNSDHCPLLLNTSLPVPSLPRPFRFEEFWIRDPTCGIDIEETWSPFVVSSHSYCLTKKLTLTKEAIKFWKTSPRRISLEN